MSPSYRIVFYVSGHGFGHTSRTVEVIDAVAGRLAGVSIAVRTSAPRRLFERLSIDFFEMQCDTGIVQLDSLHLDEAESLRQAAAFHADLAGKAAAEAAYLRKTGACLVVGDIPPLAFAAAAAAGLPSVAIGNFTWDWIYESYPGADPWIEPIRDAYRQASLALRLPMHGGFAGLETVTRDIPFIARRSRRDRYDIRRGLNVQPDKPMVLMSFGGYGLAGVDLNALHALPDYAIITNAEELLGESGYRYEDLVHAADAVVTKPGYGIISECIANDTAMLYTSRGRFPEYDVLVREMPRYLRTAFIPQDDLLAGRWSAALERLLSSPKPETSPALNGADVAAEIICNILHSSSTQRRKGAENNNQ